MFGSLTAFSLLLMLRSTESTCYSSTKFGKRARKEGYAECTTERNLMYLQGLGLNEPKTSLEDIAMGRCCQPSSLHQDWPYTCHSADWELSFSSEGWATCPPGFFLRGFYRGSSGELKSIGWATCCKPAIHPYSYPECYDEDVGVGTLWQCSRDDFFMVGIYRGVEESLSSIKKFRCCKMRESARSLTSLDQAKSRIMDVTLTNLGKLANAMGYSWAGGCRNRAAGMDFRRDGDSWKSNYQKPCEGYRAEDRLKITYGDFSFKVKKMNYGKPVVDSMKPIVQDAGEIKNEDSLPAETTITRELKTVRTVIASTTTRWKSGFGASVSLKYKSPGAASAVAGSFSASLTLSGEEEAAEVNKNENGEIQWSIFRKAQTQKIEGLTGAKYQITATRKNVTVPYKAIIQVQFSAKLEGFLRWGGGKGGDTTNFHQKYHGSEERPEVPYTIGSSTEPLYKFLKTVSQRGDNMWMWNDMKQKYEWLPKVIDALTNEKLYEFELEGNFHDVSGLSMDVNWSDVAI